MNRGRRDKRCYMYMLYHTDHLLRMLAANEIVIFGTGYVAETFWYGLGRLGLTARVSRFIITDAADSDRIFHGKPVCSLSEARVSPDAVLCLAVHPVLAEELSRDLEARMPGRVIWIYPYLHDIIYGEPIKRNIPISRQDILRNQEIGFNWLSVRYLAARDYLRRSAEYPQSRDIYIRAMSAHCLPATAARRLQTLEALADSIEARGFDGNYPLLIDESLRVIDGLHRLAVASVLGIDILPCDIVPVSEAYDTLLGSRNTLPDHVLVQTGLSSAQRERLAQAKQELITNTLHRK